MLDQHRDLAHREEEGQGGHAPDLDRQSGLEGQELAQALVDQRHNDEEQAPVARELEPAGLVQPIVRRLTFLRDFSALPGRARHRPRTRRQGIERSRHW